MVNAGPPVKSDMMIMPPMIMSVTVMLGENDIEIVNIIAVPEAQPHFAPKQPFGLQGGDDRPHASIRFSNQGANWVCQPRRPVLPGRLGCILHLIQRHKALRRGKVN